MDVAPRPPAVEPIDVDGVRAVGTGTVAWAMVLVALLLQRNELAAQGRTWWIWTAVAGAGLGLMGLQYCRTRRDRLAAARHARHSSPAEPSSG